METNTVSRSKRIKTFLSRRCRRSNSSAFLLFIAAIYLLTVYVFHLNLDERTQRPVTPADEADALRARRVLARAMRVRQEEVFFRGPDSNDTPSVVQTTRYQERAVSPQTGTFLSDRNIPLACRNPSGDYGNLSLDRFVRVAPEIRLYSAFWDERPNDLDNRHNGSFVRFTAIVTNSANPKLECLFTVPSYSAPNERYIATPVTYYEMAENHNHLYGGFILSCAVPEVIREPPCYVNVTFNDANVALVLRTLKPIEPLEEQRNFTVCVVPPLYGDITRAQLVEFIEVSTVLGADHLMFYVYRVSDDIRELLSKYAVMDGGGRVSVVSWPLEKLVASMIWYNGQSVALQDCLYRNMATSKYVVFNDIDQYIVPHRDLSWSEMSRHLEQPSQCAFQFQSSCFSDARSVNSTFVEEVGMSLETLTVLRRSSAFDKVHTRCIVKPYLIFEQGIHHISRPIWAHLVTTRVHPNVAYVHHYRPWTLGMMNVSQVTDHSMLRYKQQVIDGLLAVRKRLAHS